MSDNFANISILPEKNLVITFTLSLLLTGKELMFTELLQSKSIIIFVFRFCKALFKFDQNLLFFFVSFSHHRVCSVNLSILEARFWPREYLFCFSTWIFRVNVHQFSIVFTFNLLFHCYWAGEIFVDFIKQQWNIFLYIRNFFNFIVKSNKFAIAYIVSTAVATICVAH